MINFEKDLHQKLCEICSKEPLYEKCYKATCQKLKGQVDLIKDQIHEAISDVEGLMSDCGFRLQEACSGVLKNKGITGG